MKALVLFGSSSDEYVYAPLTESLQASCEAECIVVSAHRDPKRLAQVLRERDYHFVVAGAGLAAHLPGVVASQVDCPVIGVPVAAHFSGLDAFLSIVQMPFGVPVTACGSGEEKAIAPWANKVSQYPLESFERYDVVIHPTALQYEYAQREWKRLQEYAIKREVRLELCEEVSGQRPSIALVTEPDQVESDPEHACVLHSYLLDKTACRQPRYALNLFHLAREQGGLWVGTNNSRNALSTWLQWRDVLHRRND